MGESQREREKDREIEREREREREKERERKREGERERERKKEREKEKEKKKKKERESTESYNKVSYTCPSYLSRQLPCRVIILSCIHYNIQVMHNGHQWSLQEEFKVEQKMLTRLFFSRHMAMAFL